MEITAKMLRVFIGRDTKSRASRLNKCLRHRSGKWGKFFVHLQAMGLDLFLKHTVMAVV